MTAVPVGSVVDTAEPTHPAAPFGQKAVGFFGDVAVDLLVTFVAWMLGLGLGGILVSNGVVSREVAGVSGIVFVGVLVSSIVFVTFHLYNRVHLVGSTGRSIGRQVAGVAVLDRGARQAIGFRRALVREVLGIPARVVLAAAFLIPMWLGLRAVTSALGGISMVLAVVVAESAIATLIWRGLTSPAGKSIVKAISFHASVSASVETPIQSTHGLAHARYEGIHDRLRSMAVATWLPISVFVLFWFGTLSWEWPNAERNWLPPAWRIWQSFNDFWFNERVTSDMWPTLRTITIGLAVTIALGVALGVAIGTSKRLTEILRPLFDYIRSIPKILLITPIVALAGSGDTTSVIIIMSGAVWPLLLGTMDGVSGVSAQIDDLAASYRISRRDRYFKLVIPAASPNILAGIRTALSVAVILLIVVEGVGAASGIGYQLRAENNNFRAWNMWSAAILLAILGYLLNLVLTFVEKRVLHWFHAKGSDV